MLEAKRQRTRATLVVADVEKMTQWPGREWHTDEAEDDAPMCATSPLLPACKVTHVATYVWAPTHTRAAFV